MRSTRLDRVVIAQRAVDTLWRDAPLPDIKLGINPDPGIVGLDHWFWIKNYGGEPLVFPLHLDLPWTLYWQEQVWTTSMECDDAACLKRSAVTTSRLEDHSADYVDTVDLSVTLTPAELDWDYGDGRQQNPQPFDPVTGLGNAYVRGCGESDCSPVRWFYEFDSRDFIGGFPVTLKGTWRGTYTIASGSTFDGSYNETGSLPDRQGTWTAQHVLCQVQALNIAPGYKPPAVACHDPRVSP
jgi:hypothetical protein